MRPILTVLLILLAVSSVQARVVPMDSISTYLENALEEVDTHFMNIRAIGESIKSDSELRTAVGVGSQLNDASFQLEHTQVYFDLINQYGSKDRICDGLLTVSLALKLYIGHIQTHLSYSNHNLLAIQGNEAKKFLEGLLRDIIDSIPDKECRQTVRESVK